MTDNAQARIVYAREYDVALLRRMRLEVDGRVLARVRAGRRVDVPVPAGRHLVRVRMDWQASAPVSLYLEPGEEVVLGSRIDQASTWRSLVTHAEEGLDLFITRHRRRA